MAPPVKAANIPMVLRSLKLAHKHLTMLKGSGAPIAKKAATDLEKVIKQVESIPTKSKAKE